MGNVLNQGEFGSDQIIIPSYDTGSIGAVTTMPAFKDTFGTLNPSTQGFTVSFLLLICAVSAPFAGQLADHYSHLHVLMVGAVVFTVGAIIQCSASHLAMLLVGRGLAGLGEGLWLSNVSV